VKKKQSIMFGLLFLLLTLLTLNSDLRAAGLDIDGHAVTTVPIGNQVWMHENLNVSRYRNGDPIRYAGSNKEWLDAGAKGEGAWCYYNNDSVKSEKYGRLYNWFAVHDPRGLAPAGWHVPSDQEWMVLAKTLGGTNVAGGKMKSTELSIWVTPNVGADNSSYFSALPGGMRGIDGGFYFAGESAYYWSDSEYTPTVAWYSALNFHLTTLVRSGEQKIDGMSVRCIKD
jgi:uncharacterized protein (TIGR02145 family)